MIYLISASGSHGDVYPFVAIGRELHRRGHRVVLFSNGYFASLVDRAGLDFCPIGTADDYRRIVDHPDVTHERKGFRVVVGALMETLEEWYRKLEAAVVPGETVVVGSTLAFASRLLQETHDLPGATVHLAPSVFRSAADPARVQQSPPPSWLPPPLMRVAYRAIDSFVIDPVICPRLNAFRVSRGLPPVRRVFNEWIHSPDLTLGLFPEWFASAPDWPFQTRLTGFPLYDQPEEDLPAEVEAFLSDGPAPVLFTTGTAAASAEGFFVESAEACRRSGRRGLFLTRYRDQLPRDLPPGVRCFDHIPFSLLMPRCAAVVHHGGIGTASQALRAGVPQLVRPMAFDQFDNSRHLQRLGVARELRVKHYRANAVVDALSSLVDAAPQVAAACETCRRQLADTNAVSQTADLLEFAA